MSHSELKMHLAPVISKPIRLPPIPENRSINVRWLKILPFHGSIFYEDKVKVHIFCPSFDNEFAFRFDLFEPGLEFTQHSTCNLRILTGDIIFLERVFPDVI